MLAIYGRWYTFLPPQWSTIPPPLTLELSLTEHREAGGRVSYRLRCLREAKRELGAYFRLHETARPRQALGYRTPTAVFHKNSAPPDEASTARRWTMRPALVS